MEKQQDQKSTRDEKDLIAQDQNGRNILHRAAIEQQYKLIVELCNDYFQTIEDQVPEELSIHEQKEYILIKKQQFINTKDKFFNTPLLCACFKLKEQNQSERRALLITYLIENHADPTLINPRTLWSPIYWLAHNGDEESIKYLISVKENNPNIQINFCRPDFQGYYPIDLAGKQKNKSCVKLILEEMVVQLKYYFGQKKKSNFQKDRYMECPILFNCILYWICMLCNQDLLSQCLEFNSKNFYYEAPLEIYGRKTVFHVCAEQNFKFGLESLINELKDQYSKLSYQPNFKYHDFNIADNIVLSLNKQERQIYQKSYIDKIIIYFNWIHQYHRHLEKIKKNKIPNIVYFDQIDVYGNNPEHYASMYGNDKLLRILINQGGNINFVFFVNQVNNEGFLPKELLQHDSIRNIYENEIQDLQKAFKIAIEAQQEKKKLLICSKYQRTSTLIQKKIIQQKIKEIKSKMSIKEKIKNYFKKQYDFKIQNFSDQQKDQIFNQFTQFEYYYPDFVLQFITNKIKKNEKDQKVILQQQKQISRINFYISLLVNSKFQVTLIKSLDGEHIFCMLKLPENQLDEQCQKLMMKQKLMASYDQEPYQIQNKTLFEPFRSLSRQTIIKNYISKIIDLQVLISEKLIKQYFYMHTQGGVQQINEVWIENKVPVPLTSLKNYLTEDRNITYKEITQLNKYFGEEISYYFAWKCFYVSNLMFIAIPGLALSIYQFVYNEDYTFLLFHWILLCNFWLTIVIQKWKRKQSELNAKWGMLSVSSEGMQTLSATFVGAEFISSKTEDLQLMENKWQSTIVFILSLPVLGLIIFSINYLNFYSGILKASNTADPNFVQIVSISASSTVAILNSSYIHLATFILKKENNKYVEKNNDSLIGKLFSFKFLNSFSTIVINLYVLLMYVNQNRLYPNVETSKAQASNRQNVITQLISNKITFLATSFLIPYLMNQLTKKKYFKNLKNLSLVQLKPRKENKNKEIQKEGILQLIKILRQDKTNSYQSFITKGAVQFLYDEPQPNLLDSANQDIIEITSAFPQIQPISEMYSMEFIFISFTFLFAISAPILPFCAFILNLVMIKAQIYSMIYLNKREISAKCTGIGGYLGVWELLSNMMVFTNFALVFLDDKFIVPQIDFIKQAIGIVPEITWSEQDTIAYNEVLRTVNILFYILVSFLLKFLITSLYGGTAGWVQEEIQKLNYKLRILKEDLVKEQKNHQISLNILDEKFTKKEQNFKVKFENKIQMISDQYNQFDLQTSELQKLLHENQKQKTNYNYKQIFRAVIRMQCVCIEREIFLQRLQKISAINLDNFILCVQCSTSKACFFCLKCKQDFCKLCFDQNHAVKNQHPVEILVDRIELEKIYNPETIQDYEMKSYRDSIQIMTTSNFKQSETISNNQRQFQKFQRFNFPTQNSAFFNKFEKAFREYQHIYLFNNGFKEKKYLRKSDISITQDEYQQQDQFSINFYKIKNDNIVFEDQKEVFDLLKNNVLNQEEQYYMNKIFFYCLTKYGPNLTLETYTKYVRYLIDGSLEQRLILILDLFDNGQDLVEKQTLLDLIYFSIIKVQKDIDLIINKVSFLLQIIKNMFGNKLVEKKSTLLENILKNPVTEYLFKEILQIQYSNDDEV